MKNYQKTNLFLILFSFGILTFLGTLSFTSIQEDDIINSKIDAYFAYFENLNQYAKKDSITPNVITYSQIKNFNENDNYNKKKKDISSRVTTYSKANITITKRKKKDISNRVTTYSSLKNNNQTKNKAVIKISNNKTQEKTPVKKIVTSRKKTPTKYNSRKKETKIIGTKTTKKAPKPVKKNVQKTTIPKITNRKKKQNIISKNILVKKTKTPPVQQIKTPTKTNITQSTLSKNLLPFKKSKTPVKTLLYAKKELNTATNINLVESAPVYPNCNNKLTENDKKSCLLTNVSKYVLDHFNSDIGKKAGLKKGFYEIRILFIIDEKGNSKTYKVLGKYNTAIKNEIQRIINNLPKMIPGKANGKNVPVKYSVKVVFEVK